MPLNTVEQLKQDVQSILIGIDLDEVPQPERGFERAVSTMIQKAPVLEASGREPIMLYDRVDTYLAPEKIFGGALIDIRPQGVNRQSWDDVEKMPIIRFDLYKQFKTPSGYRVTFESRIKKILMRVSQNFADRAVTLDSMDNTDDWVLAGDASGLAEDPTVFYHQPGSLRFNLTANGASATLTKTLSDTLDLSDYEGVGVVFLAIYMPDQASTAPISSISVKVGSSASDYYEITETEGFLGSFYANDFLLVAFDLSGVSAAGSPDFSAVDYLQVTVNFTSTTTVGNVRVGDLFIALPSNHEVLFYSPAVFVHGTDDPSAVITDDTDEILFHNAAYNIYVQEAAREIAKSSGASIASGIIQGIDLVLEGTPDGKKLGLYSQFRGDNPSEEIRQGDNWYYGADGRS